MDKWNTEELVKKPNVAYLRKVVEWVEAEDNLPDGEWNQSYWIMVDEDKVIGLGQCSTKACVAGHIAMLEGWDPELGTAEKAHSHTHIYSVSNVIKGGVIEEVETVARLALGLNESQSDELFHGQNDAYAIRAIAERIAGERL